MGLVPLIFVKIKLFHIFFIYQEIFIHIYVIKMAKVSLTVEGENSILNDYYLAGIKHNF